MEKVGAFIMFILYNSNKSLNSKYRSLFQTIFPYGFKNVVLHQKYYHKFCYNKKLLAVFIKEMVITIKYKYKIRINQIYV